MLFRSPPYHDALAGELQRLKALHGFVLLWDAHSIRSHIPWLFEGKLPDFNIGTANGLSACAAISNVVVAQNQEFTQVVNGRFKGGYITRHYGQPAQHVHAVQLEKCQNLYMTETPPYAYNEALAGQVQPTLKRMVEASLQATKDLYA